MQTRGRLGSGPTEAIDNAKRYKVDLVKDQNVNASRQVDFWVP